MTREEAIEALKARFRNVAGPKVDMPQDAVWSGYVDALCAAIPGLGDVLEGAACIVPEAPTEEMADAGFKRMCDHSHLTPEDVYIAMLSATPYKEGTK